MAIMQTMSLLLVLLSLLRCSWTLVAVEANDEAALLAFKAAAIRGNSNGDPPLASWNSSSTGGLCSWEGVTCGARHRRVVALSLPSHGLRGDLSPAVGNLSFLKVLNLGDNGFTGEIPSSIGRLGRLQTLNLSYNVFSGEFPANLSCCASLTGLDLRFNQLHGFVPSNLGNKLTRLKHLSLANNTFTGTIPASLANLSTLTYLSLSFTQLEGSIPAGLGSIPGLQFLDLAFSNFSGETPSSLYNLSSLKALQIQGNRLRGSIPADIGSRFPKMQSLCFGANQFTGSIPASLTNLTNIQLLDLSQNMFTGYVPRTLGKLRALQVLYLYTTNLEADNREGWEFITSLSNCSQLRYLILGANPGFTGQLPGSIVNLSRTLQNLNFDETRVSGSIPSAISNLVGLEVLTVSDTFISGAIPDSIGNLEKLSVLHLFNTQLSGLIPSSIGNLSWLTVLGAFSGNLEGPIPESMGKLKKMNVLDLSNNYLNGSIPKEIFNLPVLSRFLNLADNSLSGRLPSEVGSLGNLNSLDLSGNQLSGEIPDSIGDCTVLQELLLNDNSFIGKIPQSLENIKGLGMLNLSMNKLSGTIPEGIGRIFNLQQMYLAHNNLSGLIPIILQNLTSLSELDLSFNNLQGPVPTKGIFKNFANFSITGNNELCGGVPQLHLAPCHKTSEEKNRKGRLRFLTIALATTGSLLFIAFTFLLARFIYKNLKQKQGRFLPPIVEEQYERVSYQALANGTNGFSEASLLGKGSFGAVYKCTFQDEGTIAAVKVFNLEQFGSTKSFVAECEVLRRVRHRCLLKIITCCSSIDHQGKEFKALVFEFMLNGSLNGWLHPQSGMPTLHNTLNLTQRLDIAIDIMSALDYLHNHCQPPIIHCDIKPSNILLAEDLSARLGDFGMSRILPQNASKILQNSNSIIGIRGSIGYVAPEYGEGSPISTLGDIYSLGILLLEMFTGKSPTNDMFRGSLDLHKFSKDALAERIWEIADTTLWLHTDACDSSIKSKIEDCLVSVIDLGISCSNKQPKARLSIQDATIKMHAIRDSYLTFARSLGVEHE